MLKNPALPPSTHSIVLNRDNDFSGSYHLVRVASSMFEACLSCVFCVCLQEARVTPPCLKHVCLVFVCVSAGKEESLGLMTW